MKNYHALSQDIAKCDLLMMPQMIKKCKESIAVRGERRNDLHIIMNLSKEFKKC